MLDRQKDIRHSRARERVGHGREVRLGPGNQTTAMAVSPPARVSTDAVPTGRLLNMSRLSLEAQLPSEAETHNEMVLEAGGQDGHPGGAYC